MVDATRLERNLNLVLQVLEITDRAVVCLNLIDEAKRHGLTLDDRRLARDLGVPVVPTAARQGEGIPLLIKTLSEVAAGQTVCRPHRIQSETPALKRAINTLVQKIESQFSGLPNTRWVALRLLEGDRRIIDAVQSGELGDLSVPSPSDVGDELQERLEVVS